MKLTQYLDSLVRSELLKMTLSKPKDKSFAYKKTVIERKKKGFQASQYTDKQGVSPEFRKGCHGRSAPSCRQLPQRQRRVRRRRIRYSYQQKRQLRDEKDVMQRKLRNGHRSQQEEKLYTFAGRGH